MIDLKIVLLLLAIHFVGDFVLQSDRMAKEKSQCYGWLMYHVAVYTAFLTLCTWSPVYAFLNSSLHMCTDAVTSRINKRLWDAKQVHYFFVSVGFDQLIHTATLLITWKLMYG